MKLLKKDIKHIAELARLELTEDELEKYGSQLSDILTFEEQLAEVDIMNTAPTARVADLENVFRYDEVNDWDKREREAALEEAPEMEDEQIKVKRILNF